MKRGLFLMAFVTALMAATGVASAYHYSPHEIDFGSVPVGSKSAVRTITLTSEPGDGMASGLQFSTSQTFPFAGTTCGSTLAEGSSCTVRVYFKPIAVGPDNGVQDIDDNGTEVALHGVGTPAKSSPAKKHKKKKKKHKKKKHHKKH